MPDPHRFAAQIRPSASLTLFSALILVALALVAGFAASPVVADGPPPAATDFLGRPVSPAAPLNVLVIGDSLVGPLATEMGRLARRDGMLHVTRDFRVGSGLAYPPYFDWSSRLSYLLAANGPEALVVSLGTNDILSMRREGRVVTVGTPGWRQEYIDRIGTLMDLAQQGGAVMYWVCPPSMADPFRNETMVLVNEAIQEAALTRPWVHVVDVWPLFTDENGEYAGELPSREGEWTQVRSNDGVHLTAAGASWMANAVYEQMQRDWEGVPYAPILADHAAARAVAQVEATPTSTPSPTPQPQPEKKKKK